MFWPIDSYTGTFISTPIRCEGGGSEREEVESEENRRKLRKRRVGMEGQAILFHGC